LNPHPELLKPLPQPTKPLPVIRAEARAGMTDAQRAVWDEARPLDSLRLKRAEERRKRRDWKRWIARGGR